PDKKRRNRGEKRVQSRIQPFNQQNKPAYFLRRRLSVGIQHRSQLTKSVAMPLFSLQSLQEQRKRLQVPGRFGHRVGYITNTLSVMEPERAACGECCQNKPAASIKAQVVNETCENE